MALIHSRLLKSAAFVESSHFQQMVRSAASGVGIEYTHGLLEQVAADTDLMDAVALPVVEGMDATLKSMCEDPTSAAELDGLVIAAVTAYTPKGA